MSADAVRQGALYSLAERYPGALPGQLHKLRARWAGEMRPPRAGEWYLSGAVIEAYRAPFDSDGPPRHIAEIVQITVSTVHHVTGIEALPN